MTHIKFYFVVLNIILQNYYKYIILLVNMVRIQTAAWLLCWINGKPFNMPLHAVPNKYERIPTGYPSSKNRYLFRNSGQNF